MALFWTFIIFFNVVDAALFLTMAFRYTLLFRMKGSRLIANLFIFSILIALTSIIWVILIITDLSRNFGPSLSIPVFFVSVVELAAYYFLWRVSMS